jgi:hypothetical protein
MQAKERNYRKTLPSSYPLRQVSFLIKARDTDTSHVTLTLVMFWSTVPNSLSLSPPPPPLPWDQLLLAGQLHRVPLSLSRLLCHGSSEAALIKPQQEPYLNPTPYLNPETRAYAAATILNMHCKLCVSVPLLPLPSIAPAPPSPRMHLQ